MATRDCKDVTWAQLGEPTEADLIAGKRYMEVDVADIGTVRVMDTDIQNLREGGVTKDTRILVCRPGEPPLSGQVNKPPYRIVNASTYTVLSVGEPADPAN